MTRYRYTFKADQHTAGYGGKWLDFNKPVTVLATGYLEAADKAVSLLGPSRSDTGGWKLFTQSIEEIEELPQDPQPPAPIIVRPRFRLKGVL